MITLILVVLVIVINAASKDGRERVPTEVTLGFVGRKPIKVDLSKHHTLIAGVTGFGK